MAMVLPKLDYRATANLRSGSLIVYEEGKAITVVQRKVALVVYVDWTPRHTRTKLMVLDGDHYRLIDICDVCQILSYEP